MRNLTVAIIWCIISAILFPYSLQGWNGPLQISDTGVNFNPSVSASSGGNAEVVWTSGSYPNLSILSSTFSAGSWSVPTAVSDSGVVDNSRIGVDSAGNAVAVWTEVTGGNTVVNASSKTAGGAWSAPSTITSAATNYNPVIAMNGTGDVIAGWINFTSDSVQVAHLAFGGAWSAPVTISTLSGPKDSLSVGVDSTGNCYAVWREYPGMDIYAAISSGSSWTAPTPLSITGNNANPVLSVGASGVALASWTNLDLNEIRAIWYSGGSWNGFPSILSSENSNFPASAALSANGFVSWLNQGYIIQVSNYDTGVWSYPPDDISGSDTNGFPSVSMDGTNTGYIIWSDFSNGVIQAVTFPTGGIPGAPAAISDPGLNYTPQVSSGGNRTVAVWNVSSDSDWLIYANVN